MNISFALPDDLRLAHLTFTRTRKGELFWHAHVGYLDQHTLGYSLGSGQDCASAQEAIDQAARHLRESRGRIEAARPALTSLGLSLNMQALLQGGRTGKEI